MKSKSTLLQEEIDFLRAQIAQLQNYILMVTPGSFAPPIMQMNTATDEISPAHRMYATELEEDIEYQLQEGLIDEEFAKRLLAEAEAENLEIEIA